MYPRVTRLCNFKFVDLEGRPKLGRKEKGGRVEDSECAVVVFRAIIRAR